MQKNRKSLWIGVAVISAILVVLGFVIHFLFKLKTVDVEIQSRLSQSETKLEEGVQAKVQSYFESDDNIILMKFDSQIKTAEAENPYLKINQVIKVFPNTIRVYISERIAKFKVKDAEDSTNWLVLDDECKVLEKVPETSENIGDYNKLIELSTDNLSISKNAGEFVEDNNTCKKYVGEIAVGIFGYSEDYSLVKSIEYKLEENKLNFYLTIKNIANENGEGCKIILQGNDDLTKKAFAGIKAFENAIEDGSITNEPSSVINVYYVDGKLVAVQG